LLIIKRAMVTRFVDIWATDDGQDRSWIGRFAGRRFGCHVEELFGELKARGVIPDEFCKYFVGNKWLRFHAATLPPAAWSELRDLQRSGVLKSLHVGVAYAVGTNDCEGLKYIVRRACQKRAPHRALRSFCALREAEDEPISPRCADLEASCSSGSVPRFCVEHRRSGSQRDRGSWPQARSQEIRRLIAVQLRDATGWQDSIDEADMTFTLSIKSYGFLMGIKVPALAEQISPLPGPPPPAKGSPAGQVSLARLQARLNSVVAGRSQEPRDKEFGDLLPLLLEPPDIPEGPAVDVSKCLGVEGKTTKAARKSRETLQRFQLAVQSAPYDRTLREARDGARKRHIVILRASCATLLRASGLSEPCKSWGSAVHCISDRIASLDDAISRWHQHLVDLQKRQAWRMRARRRPGALRASALQIYAAWKEYDNKVGEAAVRTDEAIRRAHNYFSCASTPALSNNLPEHWDTLRNLDEAVSLEEAVGASDVGCAAKCGRKFFEAATAEFHNLVSKSDALRKIYSALSEYTYELEGFERDCIWTGPSPRDVPPHGKEFGRSCGDALRWLTPCWTWFLFWMCW